MKERILFFGLGAVVGGIAGSLVTRFVIKKAVSGLIGECKDESTDDTIESTIPDKYLRKYGNEEPDESSVTEEKESHEEVADENEEKLKEAREKLQRNHEVTMQNYIDYSAMYRVEDENEEKLGEGEPDGITMDPEIENWMKEHRDLSPKLVYDEDELNDLPDGIFSVQSVDYYVNSGSFRDEDGNIIEDPGLLFGPAMDEFMLSLSVDKDMIWIVNYSLTSIYCIQIYYQYDPDAED